MVTLIELFDIAKFPIKDAVTGKALDSKEVLARPNAIVKSVSFDVKTIEFVAEVGVEE